MASNSSSPPRPWLALGAAIVVVGLVLGVLWLTREEVPPEPRPTTPVTGAEPDRPAPQLPEGRTPPDEGNRPEALEIPGGQRTTPEPTFTVDDHALQISGWVEDVGGKRLADIDVNLCDDLGEYLDTATTDEEGAFAFGWDEPLDAGWSLSTEPMFDEALSLVPAHYVHHAALMPGDSVSDCRLVLAPAPRIEGHVYDAATRAPVELADVEAVCTAPAWIDEYQDTFTEEDGTFVLPLVDIPAQGVLLKITDELDRFVILGPFDLAPGEVRYVEVALSDPPSLEGVVLDGRDGTPVDGAEVTLLALHDAFDSGEAWDITGEDGSWSLDPLDVPEDQIWIFVEADEHGPAIVHPPNAAGPVEIRLGAPVELRGTLTDESTGEPVADAIVRVVLRGPSGLLEDYEDLDFCEDDGTFRLLLETVPPEAGEIFIESDEHARYRRPLSELAPTHLGLRQYDVAIKLRPIPGY